MMCKSINVIISLITILTVANGCTKKHYVNELPGVEGFTPLLRAALHRDFDATEALLKAGTDPNETSEFGDTALCMVSSDANTDLLELLLKYNANPSCRNREGDTALTVAVMQKRDRNVYMLVEGGADINAHTKFGGNVASDAGAIGRMDLVEYFLDQGYVYDLPELRKSISVRLFRKDSEQYEIKKRLLERLSQYKAEGAWWEQQNKIRGLIK